MQLFLYSMSSCKRLLLFLPCCIIFSISVHSTPAHIAIPFRACQLFIIYSSNKGIHKIMSKYELSPHLLLHSQTVVKFHILAELKKWNTASNQITNNITSPIPTWECGVSCKSVSPRGLGIREYLFLCPEASLCCPNGFTQMCASNLAGRRIGYQQRHCCWYHTLPSINPSHTGPHHLFTVLAYPLCWLNHTRAFSGSTGAQLQFIHHLKWGKVW